AELGRIIQLCRENNIRYRLASIEELNRMFSNHQGVAARLKSVQTVDPETIFARSRLASLPVVLGLDQVQDPGNLGTLARTAAALDAMGIIIPKDRSALPGAGAIKSSAGALTRISLARVTNLARTLDQAMDSGFWIYGAALDRGSDVFKCDFSFPCVLVLGGEEKGIRPNVLKRCHEKIHIPMPGGFQSLNVAQAGAVILSQMAGRLALQDHG
ncbi:MAG: 23S rRNA (guanosine(2251)-2'-O)-methyltransferase RlmB, partial [Desulfonatronovibrionaceae bacterium]